MIASPPQEQLLTYAEVCKILGITHGGLTNAVARERFHPVKFANQRQKYIRASEVEAYRKKPDIRQIEAIIDEPAPAVVPAAFRVVIESLAQTAQDNLNQVRQATRDSLTDTAVAMVTATMKLSGMTDASHQDVDLAMRNVRKELDARMTKLMDASAPVLARMRETVTPDDLNDLENVITAFVREAALDMEVSPELAQAGENFLQTAFASVKRAATLSPGYTIPAIS